MPLDDLNHADLLDQSPDALIAADREGVIQIWNQAATRVFGFSAGEALGQRLDILLPERFRQAHWAGFERSMQSGQVRYPAQALVARAVRVDGSEIYVEWRFSVLRDRDGEAVGALATARDITDRFELERANRRRLRALEAELARLRADGGK